MPFANALEITKRTRRGSGETVEAACLLLGARGPSQRVKQLSMAEASGLIHQAKLIDEQSMAANPSGSFVILSPGARP